jgi:hypothetical protein
MDTPAQPFRRVGPGLAAGSEPAMTAKGDPLQPSAAAPAFPASGQDTTR